MLGLWVVLCGAGFAAWSVWLLTHPHWPLDPNSGPLTPTGLGLVSLLAAAVCIGGGIWLLRSRTYRPDLGDIPYLVDPFAAKAQDRSNRDWWTGDPKGSGTRTDG
jgi:hypothetical protein